MALIPNTITTNKCYHRFYGVTDIMLVCLFIRMEPSTNQVKEAVYIKAVDKWREVIPLHMQKTMYRTAPLLQQLGYK